MNRLWSIAILATVASLPLVAQTITYPLPSIAGSSLEVSVAFDPARGVYRYEYAVVAAPTNSAPISSFAIDVSGGAVAREQLDPQLQNNVPRKPANELQARTTIPVGIIAPNPRWYAGVSAGGEVFFGALDASLEVSAGSRTSGFIVESKFPPGHRKGKIAPSMEPLLTFIEGLPDDVEDDIESISDSRNYELSVETVGPIDPENTQFFDGGGQSPASVNIFLRYAAPQASRTKLASGTSSYCVIVYYGETTMPASWRAEFNGVDVADRFHPAPKTAEAVCFSLQPGSNKVQLSIEGTTPSGRTARDTDTLTLLVD